MSNLIKKSWTDSNKGMFQILMCRNILQKATTLSTWIAHTCTEILMDGCGKAVYPKCYKIFANARISYRNRWNTEALIFENLEPVEITKKLFQHHLNTLKNV